MKKPNFKIGLMVLSIVLAVTVVLASCKKKNGDDDDDGGNKELNAEEKELAGQWRGYYRGFGMYYDFRDDGIYVYVSQQSGYLGTSNWSVMRGRWSRKGNNIYLTKLKLTSWSGTSVPPNNLVWKEVSNETMLIEMREPNSDYLYRYFINHSIVDPTDGYSPRLENTPLPSWLYLGD